MPNLQKFKLISQFIRFDVSDYPYIYEIFALSHCAVRDLYSCLVNDKMPGVMTPSKIKGGEKHKPA